MVHKVVNRILGTKDNSRVTGINHRKPPNPSKALNSNGITTTSKCKNGNKKTSNGSSGNKLMREGKGHFKFYKKVKLCGHVMVVLLSSVKIWYLMELTYIRSAVELPSNNTSTYNLRA